MRFDQFWSVRTWAAHTSFGHSGGSGGGRRMRTCFSRHKRIASMRSATQASDREHRFARSGRARTVDVVGIQAKRDAFVEAPNSGSIAGSHDNNSGGVGFAHTASQNGRYRVVGIEAISSQAPNIIGCSCCYKNLPGSTARNWHEERTRHVAYRKKGSESAPSNAREVHVG
jgi:hypothetical protein